jgi:hypothetical protein
MLNKKILAAAVAVAFSSTASATIDLNETDAAMVGTLTVATESFVSGDLNSDGTLTVTNLASALDFVSTVGFTVGTGESRFVRVDLTGGEFSAVPTLAVATGGIPSASLSTGGDGESFVIFEISSDADILSTDTLTLASSTFDIDPDSSLGVTYRLYETGAGAVNELSTALLVTQTATAVEFDTASTGEFSDGNVVTATVASGFTEFEIDAAVDTTATLATLSDIDVSNLVEAGTINPDGTAFGVGDLIDVTADLVISGDFSVGAFTVSEGTCAVPANPATVTVNDDDDEATVVTANDLDAAALVFCLDVSGIAADEVIERGEYTVEIDDEDIEDGAGEVEFDTTTVDIPFVTTFSSYNQRFYIVNNSNSDALYSFSFVGEDGVTFTAGSAATGTAPANQVTLIRSTDLVTITGRTRIAAVLDVELTQDDVSVATQIINLSNGGTDTVVLSENQ